MNNSSNKIAHLRPDRGVLGESKKQKKKTLDTAVVVRDDSLLKKKRGITARSTRKQALHFPYGFQVCQNIVIIVGDCGANGRTEKITSSERHNSYQRLFCNPRLPRDHVIYPCGCVSGGKLFFARPTVKPKQSDAQEPAKLRRSYCNPKPRRSALKKRIWHPGRDGRQHGGRPAWVAR